MPVVHHDNKIGQVGPRFRTVSVGHLQPKIMVLHIGLDSEIGLSHAEKGLLVPAIGF